MRFLADENLNYDIVRGIRRRSPDVDLVRVQDINLESADDATVLEWAAQAQRVILTHDATTMTHYAYERVVAGLPMPGVFEIGRGLAVGHVIEDVRLIAECSLPNEWEGQVRYLPLR